MQTCALGLVPRAADPLHGLVAQPGSLVGRHQLRGAADLELDLPVERASRVITKPLHHLNFPQFQASLREPVAKFVELQHW